MKTVTVKVAENKYELFLQFLKELRFVKVLTPSKGDSKDEVLKNISQGLKEMKLIKKGTLKGRDAKDFLNEL